jgi:hypothetical protein
MTEPSWSIVELTKTATEKFNALWNQISKRRAAVRFWDATIWPRSKPVIRRATTRRYDVSAARL